MKIKCDYCGRVFERRPSRMKTKNYCSKDCLHKDKYVMLTCETCGKKFERLLAAGIHKHNFCSRNCAKPYLSKKFSDYDVMNNPTAMTIERRTKLRNSRLDQGAGKTYAKTFGRHTHRIVAEQMLGRALRPGEVVHHINENKRDNRPENLMIFANQALHAKWHIEHDGCPNKRNK